MIYIYTSSVPLFFSECLYIIYCIYILTVRVFIIWGYGLLSLEVMVTFLLLTFLVLGSARSLACYVLRGLLCLPQPPPLALRPAQHGLADIAATHPM